MLNWWCKTHQASWHHHGIAESVPHFFLLCFPLFTLAPAQYLSPSSGTSRCQLQLHLLKILIREGEKNEKKELLKGLISPEVKTVTGDFGY